MTWLCLVMLTHTKPFVSGCQMHILSCKFTVSSLPLEKEKRERRVGHENEVERLFDDSKSGQSCVRNGFR
jgi:hypothetical protein